MLTLNPPIHRPKDGARNPKRTKTIAPLHRGLHAERHLSSSNPIANDAHHSLHYPCLPHSWLGQAAYRRHPFPWDNLGTNAAITY